MAYPPPPTYADVVLIDEVTKKGRFNPIWLKWFLELASTLESSGSSGGALSHNSLADLQGGGTGERFHLTNSQHTALTAGFTGTGNLARASSPSFTTPNIGVASGTSLALTSKITIGDANALVATSVNLANGAGAGAGTLTNAPTAGDPAKWIKIDDNGTVRYIPTWI